MSTRALIRELRAIGHHQPEPKIRDLVDARLQGVNEARQAPYPKMYSKGVNVPALEKWIENKLRAANWDTKKVNHQTLYRALPWSKHELSAASTPDVMAMMKYVLRKNGKPVPSYLGEAGMNEQTLWIQRAVKAPGALRKALGVKKGENIPTKSLKKLKAKLSAKAAGDKTLSQKELRQLRQVNLALTLRGPKVPPPGRKSEMKMPEECGECDDNGGYPECAESCGKKHDMPKECAECPMASGECAEGCALESVVAECAGCPKAARLPECSSDCRQLAAITEGLVEAKRKAKKFMVDHIVRYTGKFLRSIGMYAGGPINGKVVAISPSGFTKGWPKIKWSDGGEPMLVNPVNIELDPRARAHNARVGKGPEAGPDYFEAVTMEAKKKRYDPDPRKQLAARKKAGDLLTLATRTDLKDSAIENVAKALTALGWPGTRRAARLIRSSAEFTNDREYQQFFENVRIAAGNLRGQGRNYMKFIHALADAFDGMAESEAVNAIGSIQTPMV